MKRALLGFALGSCLLGSAMAQEVVLRHNLSGKALDALVTSTLKFNDAQRGKAKVVLQGATTISEDERNKPPHFALLDTDEAYAFFNTRPRFVPIHKILKDAGESLDNSTFYPQIRDVVDDSKGRLEALPVGMAFPALFRNKAAFVKAGLDPDKPPRTWMEVQDVAGKLQDAGYKCPLTSANFARLHTDNVSSQHGQSITDKKGATLNSLINVKHLSLLSSWQKSSYFHYYGRHREAEERFLSGQCAMITTDTTLYAAIAAVPGLDAAASALPYHDDAYTSTPDQVLPDGASLWVLAGKKKDEYKVVARFLKYFSQPEVQRDWVAATAHLPMTPAAMAALRQAGAFTPSLLERAEKRLQVATKSSGRFRSEEDRSRMRTILNEEIETVWQNRKPPMEALNDAVLRINAK